MKNAVLVGLVLLATTGSTHAQTSLTIWADMSRGVAAVSNVHLVLPIFEAVVVTQGNNHEIEIGRLVPIGHGGWTGGGYVTYRPEGKQAFLQPWFNFSGKGLGGQVYADLSLYLPVDRGRPTFYMDEASVTWPVTRGLRLGPAAYAWCEDSSAQIWQTGAVAKMDLGRSAALSVRWLKDPNTLRLQGTFSF